MGLGCERLRQERVELVGTCEARNMSIKEGLNVLEAWKGRNHRASMGFYCCSRW